MKERIREFALAAGFDVVRFTSADADPADAEALARFLKAGYQGDMHWMADTGERRVAPRALMDTVSTIIVVGSNYGPRTDPRDITGHPDRGAISAYAQTARDYHDLVKTRLKRVGRWIAGEYGGDLKVFVDTAPVMEKPLAARAGAGWQGKHSNLVSRDFGSWLFLGEIFLTLDLEPDAPEVDHCGSCDLCMRACPTGAIPEPYHLEATKCVSYLTIEHKGKIAPGLMENMGNRIYGCDDCLAVCPWNKFASPSAEPGYRPRPELTAPTLKDLAALDDAAFRRVFAGSPVKRTGRDRFVRNVLIAIGNSADPAMMPITEQLSGDRSDVVADTAKWARRRLGALDVER